MCVCVYPSTNAITHTRFFASKHETETKFSTQKRNDTDSRRYYLKNLLTGMFKIYLFSLNTGFNYQNYLFSLFFLFFGGGILPFIWYDISGKSPLTLSWRERAFTRNLVPTIYKKFKNQYSHHTVPFRIKKTR